MTPSFGLLRQRANLAITIHSVLERTVGKPFQAYVFVLNTSQTPAKARFKGWCRVVEVGTSPHAPFPDGKKIDAHAAWQPCEPAKELPLRYTVQSDKLATDESIAEIEAGTGKRLYIYGTLNYKDDSGDLPPKSFCAYYQSDAPGGYPWISCPDHDEHDERRTLPPPSAAGRPVLHSIALGNFLSFGPEMPRVPLGNLNVLVGPNGSGKSNLLEAIALLRSAPWDLRPVILRGGGVGEWIWKGAPHGNATLEASVTNPDDPLCPIRHVLAFRAEQQSFRLEDERIENDKALQGQTAPLVYYRYQHGRPVVLNRETKIVALDEIRERNLRPESVQPDLSILAQLRDPESYPEITNLARIYDQIRLYREWAFGRNTIFREPQRADMRNDRLEEDFSNLGLVLNRLRRQGKVKAALVNGLRDLYEGLTDFEISIDGGTVQVLFQEGDFSIPATRLSDGSLRYLCLLAILCDPEPPPLIGLEEPELGLHPDLLPKVADLLVVAAERTQLIVTTHSDILVDALTEYPEALVVCEKHEGRTTLRRLANEELQPWLENYRLGQLWTQGQLGGTRW